MAIEVANDISANTLITTVSIGVATWLLKSTMKALIAACKMLTVKIVETLAAVAVMEKQVQNLLGLSTDIQKLKVDVDSAWSEIRKMRAANH